MSETFTPIFYSGEPIRAGWCNLYSRGPEGAQEVVGGVVCSTRKVAVALPSSTRAFARVRIIPKVPA